MRLSKAFKSFLWISSLVVAVGLATTVVLAAVLGNYLENISKTSFDAGYPAIAVTGANGQFVGIVWAKRYVGGTAARGPIFFKGSTDGVNLSGKTVVDNSDSQTNQSLTPDVASDPTNPTTMHVVWVNYQGPGSIDQRIYYSLCTIGSTCTARQQITLVNGFRTVSDPQVTANATPVTGVQAHAVWQFDDVSSGGTTRVIQYSCRNSAGNWSAPVNISNSAFDAYRPALAVSNVGGVNYLHVAWASDTDSPPVNPVVQNRIEYIRGTVGANCAVTWDNVVNIKIFSPGPGVVDPDYPTVAAGQNVVAVLWDARLSGAGNDDRYYPQYTLSETNGGAFNPVSDMLQDAGATSPVRSDNNPSSSSNLLGSEHAKRLQLQATFQLTTTAPITGLLHVVWHQTTSNASDHYHDIWYAYNTIGSDACGPECGWSAPTNETAGKKFGSSPNAHYYSMSPDMGVGPNGRLHLVYMEGADDVAYDLADSVFNIIYNGSSALVEPFPTGIPTPDPDPTEPTPTPDPSKPTIRLPIILKGA
jgi:hypothetical protein